MSIAGIRSNRGDGYQTLVAFDWALTLGKRQWAMDQLYLLRRRTGSDDSGRRATLYA
jgi:hypothetical protein